MRKVLLGLAAALGLFGCEKPLTAPGHAGVCWRMVEGMNGKPDFKPVAPDIDTLENCAVRLEEIHVADGQPVTGAFQGRFIYVTDEEISAASGPNAQRYRVFTPAQRLEIQQGIETLMAREKTGG